MKILQSRSFERKVKKISKKEKKILDEQLLIITESPSVGEEKKGDLSGVYVYKFKIKAIQYLLSYRFVQDDLELILLGLNEKGLSGVYCTSGGQVVESKEFGEIHLVLLRNHIC